MAQVLDRRLVHPFLDLVLVILIQRHRSQGLVLSELGDQLLGLTQGPAGVKRITRLLHSTRWQSDLLVAYLWELGSQAVNRLVHPQEDVYVLWDESVLEKPESLHAEGLCAVRSAKAPRLKRIKPGYFNPPGAALSLCPATIGCKS